MAKKALEWAPKFISVPHRDWFTAIRRRRYQIWEERWKEERRKMFEIKSKPGRWKEIRKLMRRDEVVINRLRLEHTNVTHGYRFETESDGHPPICNRCKDAIQQLNMYW